MRKEAATFRVLIMLACAVGIPVLATWGTCWPDVLKKFQDFRWPALLSLASAPPSEAESEAPEFAPPVVENETQPLATAPETDKPRSLEDRLRELGGRLQQLGATYYRLESWGHDAQLYRFQCKVSLADDSDLVRCYEAIENDPLRAMLQVLREVEAAGLGRTHS